MNRPRIVLDTNVCLALFLYADPQCAALRSLLTTHQPIANAATRDEWLRVLHQGRFPHDSAARQQAQAAFDACVTLIQLPTAPQPLPRCRDPDDQKFLVLARDGGARTLYSRDRELMRLSQRTQRMAGFAVLAPERAQTQED